jgi:hypothetical protein
MTQVEQKERSKTEKDQFELIKGVFSAEDASEILYHLINEKINFHNMRSFSQHERFGSGDVWSNSRVEDLKLSKEAIRLIIEQARAQGKMLNIKSNITIEVI